MKNVTKLREQRVWGHLQFYNAMIFDVNYHTPAYSPVFSHNNYEYTEEPVCIPSFSVILLNLQMAP